MEQCDQYQDQMKNQRFVYNEHKRVHAIKFQSVAVPNGIIVNLYGPVEGIRHNNAMLALSGLLPQMEAHCNGLNGPL